MPEVFEPAGAGAPNENSDTARIHPPITFPR